MAVGHACISLTDNVYNSDLLGIRLSRAMQVNALRQRYPAERLSLNGFEFFQKIGGVRRVGDMNATNAVVGFVVVRVHKLRRASIVERQSQLIKFDRVAYR